MSSIYSFAFTKYYVFSPSSITNALLDNKSCYKFRLFLRTIIRQPNTIHKTVNMYLDKFLSLTSYQIYIPIFNPLIVQ
jgi:hypothetical protein